VGTQSVDKNQGKQSWSSAYATIAELHEGVYEMGVT